MASSVASASHSHHADRASRPTASNTTRTPSSSSSLGPGPAPDLTERFKLKAKYLDLQRDYFRALEVRNPPCLSGHSTLRAHHHSRSDTRQIRKDLTIEVKEKQDKMQSLQDEVDLLIDQIFDSDYAQLQPSEDDLFSPSEDEHDGVPEQAVKDKQPRPAPSLEPSASAGGVAWTGSHGVIRKDPPNADSGNADDSRPLAKRARVDESGSHHGESSIPNGRRVED
ncbi:BQ2448_3085 [Microbotryum intermedium]|uniref:BQ2448_3085 protein n=1 Tax=Microbotryum intermedium TaxID=269621 RepID=A0A238FE78_9BASI|nr:BQ2448_3085 [Microbotryum intermedium]